VQAVNTNPPQQTDGGIFVYVGTHPVAAGALKIFQVCTSIGPQGCSAQDVASFALKPVTTPPPPTPGAKPVAMLVDTTNQFLYVACEDASLVYGYKINTTSGVLSALNPANKPTGSQPVALALHPSVNSSGAFLYTSNSGSSNISGFSVSTTTGSMGSSITVNSPSTPSGMAAR
jgi:6-phosphogluconolactonase (cycloisomerase 2 family)